MAGSNDERAKRVVDVVRAALTEEQQTALYDAVLDVLRYGWHDYSGKGDPSLKGQQITVTRSLVYQGDGEAVTRELARSLATGDHRFGRDWTIRIHQGVTEFVEEKR